MFLGRLYLLYCPEPFFPELNLQVAMYFACTCVCLVSKGNVTFTYQCRLFDAVVYHDTWVIASAFQVQGTDFLCFWVTSELSHKINWVYHTSRRKRKSSLTDFYGLVWALQLCTFIFHGDQVPATARAHWLKELKQCWVMTVFATVTHAAPALT